MSLTLGGLTRQTSVYGIFQLLQKAVNFAVIPLYTHYISPEQFGALDILYLIVWFVGIIGGSKLDAAFVRYYAAAKSEGKVAQLVSSSVIGLVVFATTFCALGALAARPVLEFMYSSKALPLEGYYLALCATWLELVGSLPLSYLRARQEARLVGTISLVQSLSGTIVGVCLVTLFGMGYLGILVGIAVSGLVLLGGSFYFVTRRLTLVYDTSYVRRLFRYALPMLPAPVFMYLLNYVDRYFLLRFGSLADVGIYSMAYKFGMLINLVVMSPFGEMWAVNQFALHEAGDKPTYQRISLIYVSVMYFVALGITYTSYDITVLGFSRSFQGLLAVVPILTVGIAIWGIVPTLDFGCQIRDRTWLRSFTTGAAALAKVALSWVLIHRYGAVGAAFATLLAFVILVWITHALNKPLTDYHIEMDKLWWPTLLLGLLSGVVYLAPVLHYALFTLLRALALAVFGYVLLQLNGISIVELRDFALRRRVARS
jgi:O-antigen/teichoic acid export membrane protein